MRLNRPEAGDQRRENGIQHREVNDHVAEWFSAMSDAKLKYSNCGAELTNLTFSWGKRQWLWTLLAFIPFVALMVWMRVGLFGSSYEYVTELKVSLIETRVAQDRFDILGRLKNDGSHTWGRVTVEAEIFDKDGKFVDEVSDYLSGTLSPGAEEHFRLSFFNPDEKILNKSSKVVLKVADADEDRF